VPPGDPKRFRPRLLIVVAVVVLVMLAGLWFAPPASLDSEQWANVLQALCVLALASTAVAASGQRLALYARDLAVWLGVGLVLIVGYSYRIELTALRDRVVGELLPGHVRSIGAGAFSVARAADGQFHLDATVNGQPVHFVVDTGASGIALSRADAVRLGFDPARLDYSERFRTANGDSRGAPVRLDSLTLGEIRFSDVPASVAGGDLDESLLGMALLERFARIEISGDTLTIAP
jgi:aspartyl protease family protein